jgi:hypothetical protein
MHTPTITRARHVAVLDALTGFGLLAVSGPESDVIDPLPHSALTLGQGDWDRMMADLGAAGWEPTEDEGGMPMFDGRLADGREVVALFGLDPITTMPTIAELVEARARCLATLMSLA